MINKKRIVYTKLVILILCFFISLRIFVLVLSKYESISNSNEKIEISKLHGNNGKISEKELRNWQKILTN